ncbi:hypothetical protein GJAV_G00233610 [Gymnothorax javanicus]|nr:hypothetical protein GJAV_G00233610 [Gymnothorax javanicus]
MAGKDPGSCGERKVRLTSQSPDYQLHSVHQGGSRMTSNGDLGEFHPGGSFWEPGNYKRTVRRVEEGHKLCTELVSCMQERAKIEKGYSLQLAEWARKWTGIVEKGAQYASLEKAWLGFMDTAERLSEVHTDVMRHLLEEQCPRVLQWQRDAFHKQLIGGFRESKEAEDGFHKAQKVWAKKLKDVESTQKRYHQARKTERVAVDRESIAKADSTKSPDEVHKLQDRVEKCKKEAGKAKERYEKALEELNRCNPRYMEDMEQVFEMTQEAEKKRLCFFKEVFLEIHKQMDLPNNSRVISIFQDLGQSITTASDAEDLRWWRNTHGPGMHMNWPHFEEWSPENSRSVNPRKSSSQVEDLTLPAGDEPLEMPLSSPSGGKDSASDWSDESSRKYIPTNGVEEEEKMTPVRVKALYDYAAEEGDELSFKAGDELMKLTEEDEQGWCKGQLDDGQLGLYPANYVEVVGS